MAENARLIVRKVYVWRAVLFGLLYGLIFGVLFVSVVVYTLWSFSESRGLTPPGITQGDLFLLGGISAVVFAVVVALGALISATFYNLLAHIGGGLHVELEERQAVNISSSTLSV